MKILSNFEFHKLVEDQSPRLKQMAKLRYESNPNGNLSDDDLNLIIATCTSSGDKKATTYLKNLKLLAMNGKLEQIRNNPNSFEVHAMDVRRRFAAGEIAFDIGDHIMMTDTGKRGTVVDYNPDTKNFIVALTPFQIVEVEKSELKKVGKRVKAMKLRHIRPNMTELDLPNAVVLFSYQTPVAYQDKESGRFFRTDQRFSNTTSRHITQWLGTNSAETVPQGQIDMLVNS